MAIPFTQVSVANTPIKIAAVQAQNRTLAITLPYGQIFVGATAGVTPATGFAVNAGTTPFLVPVPNGIEVWVVANVQSISPVKVYFTVVDGPLTDAELRATPLVINPAGTPLTPSAPVSVVVGTTSIQLVAANVNRKGLYIGVTGTGNIVSLGFGAVAVANKGIVLRNAGIDVFKMDAYNFTTGQINGVANGAGTVVAVQEFL